MNKYKSTIVNTVCGMLLNAYFLVTVFYGMENSFGHLGAFHPELCEDLVNGFRVLFGSGRRLLPPCWHL